MLFASQARHRITASTRRRGRRPQVESLEPRLALSTLLGPHAAGPLHHHGPVSDMAVLRVANRSAAHPVSGHSTHSARSGHSYGRSPSGLGHLRTGHRHSTSTDGRAAGRAGLVSTASVSSITATTNNNGGYAWADGVQPNGKIVVVGTAGGLQRGGLFALARYNPDLTLDTSFGAGGKQTTSLSPKGNESLAFSMAIDHSNTGNNGKIIAAGTARASFYKGGYYEDFAIARYTTSGALDKTFGGGDGYVTTNTSSSATGIDSIDSVAIDGADRIIAAGIASNGSYNVVTLARYTPQGTLDTSFNSGGAQQGVVKLDFGLAAEAESVLVDRQGNYLVAGTLNNSLYPGGTTNQSDGVFLARFSPSGALDPGFGVGGVMRVDTLTGNRDHFHSMALDGAGNIVVAGHGVPPVTGSGSMLVARYTPAGNLDTTFGSGAGFVTNGVAIGNSVAIEPGTGSIVVGGFTFDNSGTQYYAMTRLLPGGAVDTSFGAAGWLVYGFPNFANAAVGRAIAISPYNGHYVLAGYLQPTGSGPESWGILDVQP